MAGCSGTFYTDLEDCLTGRSHFAHADAYLCSHLAPSHLAPSHLAPSHLAPSPFRPAPYRCLAPVVRVRVMLCIVPRVTFFCGRRGLGAAHAHMSCHVGCQGPCRRLPFVVAERMSCRSVGEVGDRAGERRQRDVGVGRLRHFSLRPRRLRSLQECSPRPAATAQSATGDGGRGEAGVLRVYSQAALVRPTAAGVTRHVARAEHSRGVVSLTVRELGLSSQYSACFSLTTRCDCRPGPGILPSQRARVRACQRACAVGASGGLV